MKHFNRYSLAMLPLLSILAFSPSSMEMKTNYRGIASLEEQKPELPKPRFGEEGRLPHGPARPGPGARGPKVEAKPSVVVDKPKKEEVVVKDEGKKSDKPVEHPLIKQALEAGEKPTEDKKEDVVVKDEGKKSDKPIEHPLIKQALENGEKPTEDKKEDVVVKDEGKKDEPKKEDEKKEEVIVVKDEKKEEKKDDKAVCEQDEKVQLLTKQVESLLADQKQIMMTMMSMTQMMMTMMQNQQNQNPWAPYSQGMTMQSPYQYAPQQTAGNWVYYPQGFQPSQINIFAQQPQMQQQQQPMSQQGIFPDQMHMQQSSNWGLRPQMSFDQAMPMTMQPTPGNFGGDMGFNLGGAQQQMPMVSQFR